MPVTDYTTLEGWAPLLAAILAAPDDDLPRLVAADWLEERGFAERAELIRVQCGRLYAVPCGQVAYPLADHPDIGVSCLDYVDGRTEPADGWCPQCRTRHRVMQIIEGWDDDDTRHVPHPFWGNGWTVYAVKTYDRGFVHTARGPLAKLLGVLPESVRAEPVAAVEVTDREPANPATSGDWLWFAENDYDGWEQNPCHHLPGDLFDLIEVYCDYIDSDMCIPYKRLDTRESATAHLSAAILKHARQPAVA